MPNETQDAIVWALLQSDANGDPITKTTEHTLVEKVREYFNAHEIEYGTFAYDDLLPYLS